MVEGQVGEEGEEWHVGVDWGLIAWVCDGIGTLRIGVGVENSIEK